MCASSPTSLCWLLKWRLWMNGKQLLHCVDHLSNTYHQGHNCEPHCWDEYPHPKKREIAWNTVSLLQPILIVNLFCQSLHRVELYWKCYTDYITQCAVLTVSCSEQLISHLSPMGSRTANFNSFPSIWLICVNKTRQKKKRKGVLRREMFQQSCHLNKYLLARL